MRYLDYAADPNAPPRKAIRVDISPEVYRHLFVRSFCRSCWLKNPRAFTPVGKTSRLFRDLFTASASNSTPMDSLAVCPHSHNESDTVLAVLWPPEPSVATQAWRAVRLPPRVFEFKEYLPCDFKKTCTNGDRCSRSHSNPSELEICFWSAIQPLEPLSPIFEYVKKQLTHVMLLTDVLSSLLPRSTVNIHAVVANYHAQHATGSIVLLRHEKKPQEFLGVEELARIREIRSGSYM